MQYPWQEKTNGEFKPIWSERVHLAVFLAYGLTTGLLSSTDIGWPLRAFHILVCVAGTLLGGFFLPKRGAELGINPYVARMFNGAAGSIMAVFLLLMFYRWIGWAVYGA